MDRVDCVQISNDLPHTFRMASVKSIHTTTTCHETGWPQCLQPIGEDIGEDEFYAFLVLLQKEETMEPHGFKLAWTKVKDISERCKFST